MRTSIVLPIVLLAALLVLGVVADGYKSCTPANSPLTVKSITITPSKLTIGQNVTVTATGTLCPSPLPPSACTKRNSSSPLSSPSWAVFNRCKLP